MAQTKLHLTPDGPKKCTATKRPCKFVESPHFDNSFDANKAYEEQLAEEHGTLPDLLKKRRLSFELDKSFLKLPNKNKLTQYKEQYAMSKESFTKGDLTFTKVSGNILDSTDFHKVHISGKINPEVLDDDIYKDFGFAKYDHRVNLNSFDLSGADNRPFVNETTLKKYHNLESGEDIVNGIRFEDKETKESINIFSSESGYKVFQNFARTGKFDKSQIQEEFGVKNHIYENLQNETDESFQKHIDNMDAYLDDGFKIQRRLYRGISEAEHGINVEEWLDNHSVGSTFENDGYTSTSSSSSVGVARAQQGGKEVNNSPGILFDIISSEGRALGGHSLHKLEKEVLLPRNSRFMVVGIDRDIEVKSGVKNYSINAVVKLVQVDENNNVL